MERSQLGVPKDVEGPGHQDAVHGVDKDPEPEKGKPSSLQSEFFYKTYSF